MIEKNDSTPVTTAPSPAHNTGTSGRWRQAATTSDVEGVSPSQHETGQPFNKDRANALALFLGQLSVTSATVGSFTDDGRLLYWTEGQDRMDHNFSKQPKL